MRNLSRQAAAFVVLWAISSGVTLLFKSSQTHGFYGYSTGSAQTSAEVLKLAISCGFLWREHKWDRLHVVFDSARSHLSPALTGHLVFLSLLYASANQLAFLLLKVADPATVTLFKAGGTLVSGLMMWIFLSRPLTSLQILAVVLQSAGLFTVEYDNCRKGALYSLGVYGLLALSLLLFGTVNVYNEGLLKGYEASINLQNAVLYVFGALFNFLFFVGSTRSGGAVFTSFFHGYNVKVVSLILCQALLGLVVSAVLKYSDTVVRTSAAACTTAFLYIVGVVVFGAEFNPAALVGCLIVFLSTHLYISTGHKPGDSGREPESTAERVQSEVCSVKQTSCDHHEDSPRSPYRMVLSFAIATAFVAVGAFSIRHVARVARPSAQSDRSIDEAADSVLVLYWGFLREFQTHQLLRDVLGRFRLSKVGALLAVPTGDQRGLDHLELAVNRTSFAFLHLIPQVHEQANIPGGDSVAMRLLQRYLLRNAGVMMDFDVFVILHSTAAFDSAAQIMSRLSTGVDAVAVAGNGTVPSLAIVRRSAVITLLSCFELFDSQYTTRAFEAGARHHFNESSQLIVMAMEAAGHKLEVLEWPAGGVVRSGWSRGRESVRQK